METNFASFLGQPRTVEVPSGLPLQIVVDATTELIMALTGRFDLRKTFTGKIVLQVEEEVKSLWPGSNETKKRWRDATLLDLTTPQMRTLMDARFRPSLLSYVGPADRAAASSPLEAGPAETTTVSPHIEIAPQQKAGGRSDRESERRLRAL